MSHDYEKFTHAVESENELWHYLTSTPFSHVDRGNYEGVLTPGIFKEKFYHKGDLSDCEKEIAECLEGGNRNIFLIYGYRGCGKTVFVNYLLEDLYGAGGDGSALGGPAKRIHRSLIDFEKEQDAPALKDGERVVRPAASKFVKGLLRMLRRGIAELASEDPELFERSQRTLEAIVEKAHNELFGIQYGNELISFANEYLELSKRPLDEDIRAIEQSLEASDASDVLRVVTLYYFCVDVAREGNASFRRFFVFDNLDDELDEGVISDFIRGFVNYVRTSPELFDCLKFKNFEEMDLSQSGFNENFAFVFCLRDTNVAKFTAHLRDRRFYFGCDISNKVDRQIVLQKKLAFLDDGGARINEGLRQQKNLFEKVMDDYYVFDTVYRIFNNGYRTTVNALDVAMFSNERQEASTREYGRLIDCSKVGSGSAGLASDAAVFGAHGIMLRLLFDLFRDERYLQRIGGSDGEFSIPRIILTLLYNRSPTHPDRGARECDKMLLSELGERLDCAGVRPEVIAERIDTMYRMHESSYWSHLLEIDSDHSVGIPALEEELAKGSGGTTRVYITCAGRQFVERISTHFEYFAARYVKGSKPLYSERNLEREDGRLRLEKLLVDVFGQVVSCVCKIEEHDRAFAEEKFGGDLGQFFRSDYVYKYEQTHAERIINHHISYIDSYRQFVLGVEKGEVDVRALTESYSEKILGNEDEILEILIGAIRKYIRLMERLKNGGEMEVIDRYDKAQSSEFQGDYMTDMERGLLDLFSGRAAMVNNARSDVVISFDPTHGK